MTSLTVTRGNYSRFTHESKFEDNINTQILAQEALNEGNRLRALIKNKRILNTIIVQRHDPKYQ